MTTVSLMIEGKLKEHQHAIKKNKNLAFETSNHYIPLRSIKLRIIPIMSYIQMA